MSSYNIINGHRASENRDLLTGILREEWGFKGLVTTDWYTHGEQYREINAGNDVKMGRGMKEETLKALADGRLSREAMETSVRRVLELLMKLA
jgi:beta-glucosidase